MKGGWQRLQERAALHPQVKAVGLWSGKSGDWTSLDPGWSAGGTAWLKQVRETLQVLRLHRLPQNRLHWQFEGGSLLAVSQDDWISSVLIEPGEEFDCSPLWPILEGNENL